MRRGIAGSVFVWVSLIFLWSLGGSSSFLLAGQAAAPLTYSGSLEPLSTVPTLGLPKVDPQARLLEDREEGKAGLSPLRFAVPVDLVVTPRTDGKWERSPEGGEVWRLRVDCPGATDLNFGFTRYRLPEGAALYVLSDTAGYFRGPYGCSENAGHGQLWTPVIPGGSGVIELFLPEDVVGQEELVLSRVGCGYRDLFRKAGHEKQGSCNIDVICPEGDPWRDQIQSVAVYQLQGFLTCTGAMVNNTARDFKPYFLTANHCGVTAGTAPTLVAYWNFQSPHCGDLSGGNLNQPSVGGAIFRAASAPSDFTLAEFVNPPDPAYNVYWAGWDNTGVDPPSAVTIHHPNCDEKAISFEDHPLSTTSYYGNNSPGDGTHLRVLDYDVRPSGEGTTEPGSSGSPLFNPEKRVVAQLHGGNAACGNDLADWWGKLSVSWTGGGTDVTRLSNWLDPGSTGVTTLDGSFPIPPCEGRIDLDGTIFNCRDVITITVTDGDLAGAGTHNVMAWSDTETTPETVTLTESPVGSGQFSGTVRTSSAVVHGDGAVGVANGDTITVRYVDSDYCGTPNVSVDAGATADCAAPVISNVQAVNVTGDSADIIWDTNENADSFTAYGMSVPPAPGTAADGALVTGHTLHLTGLQECTTYFYSVASADGVGNRATDDNGGTYYTFTTGRNNNPTFVSTDTPIPIPDNDLTGISSVITVTDSVQVLDVNVTVNIAHTADRDVDIYLIGPNSVQVELSTDNGGRQDNYINTVFDDEAATPITAGFPPFTGSFRPEGSLSTLDGQVAAGDWTLLVADDAAMQTGTLNSWSLTLTYPPQPCASQVEYSAHTRILDTCSIGGPGNNDGIWDAGEEVQFSLTLYNNGAVPLTGVTAAVTPLTAGVTMADGSASYNDIQPGNTETSQPPHFTVRLPASLNCGDAVSFQVDITSAQGSWTSTFSQTIGNVVPPNCFMNTCDAGGFPPGEVSGPGTVFPLKIVKDSASCASGFCLEFEKETSATGYNIYEGTLGSWYSHGGAAGNVCDGTVTDLGANRMRVSLAPSGGDHYYVVTALNTFGEGTAGNPASDAQCSCPP